MEVPNPSAGVGIVVGTMSVAEAAALEAAGVKTLLVSKQIYRVSTPESRQAVTVAIAQVQRKTPEEF